MSWNQNAHQFLTALGSAEPTPGGGAAAAMVGAMGCALLRMAVGTTLKRKATPQQHKTVLTEQERVLASLQVQLEDLMQQDAQAYNAYLSAYRLPNTTSSREEQLQASLFQAATVPVQIANTCEQLLKQINPLKPRITPIILSDVACAEHLLKSALACSIENIQINLKGLRNPAHTAQLQQRIVHFTKVLKNESDLS